MNCQGVADAPAGLSAIAASTKNVLLSTNVAERTKSHLRRGSPNQENSLLNHFHLQSQRKRSPGQGSHEIQYVTGKSKIMKREEMQN